MNGITQGEGDSSGSGFSTWRSRFNGEGPILRKRSVIFRMIFAKVAPIPPET